MKARSPAFSFYPKDILSDETVVAMTDEEFGVYVRLLCHAWLEGSIPSDPTRLARMTRRSRRSFDRIWPAIAPCWTLDAQEGRLVQGRLEREREKQNAYSAKQSARGSKGGRPRITPSVSTKKKTRGKPAVNPQKSLPSPSPSPTPHITENDLPAVAGEEPRKSWTREAAEDWDARFGLGSCNPGRIGFALGKIVKAHGWDAVRPPWRRYLVERDPTFANPQDFAGKFKAWQEGSTGADDLESHNRREAAKAIQRAKQRPLDVTPSRKGLPAHEGFSRVLPPKE